MGLALCDSKGQCQDALSSAEAASDCPELERLQSACILQLEQKTNHRLVPPQRERALYSCILPMASSEAPPRAGDAPPAPTCTESCPSSSGRMR